MHTNKFQFINLDISIDSPILLKLIENNEFSELDQLFDQLPKDKKAQCMQIVLKNHYIDLLSQNRISEAVEFLKNQIGTIVNYIDEDQKPQLTGLILENVFPVQKSTIINQILNLCHQELGVLEPCRLTNLIHQSLANEIIDCEFHSQTKNTLLKKHTCSVRINQKFIFSKQINIIEYSRDLQVNVSSTNLIIIENNRNQILNSGHTDVILSISISPCNQFIATSSQDKSIRIHEFRVDRQQLLQGHTEAVKEVVWMSGVVDNYKLLSISVDGWLFEWEKGQKIWSMKTEEKVLKMSLKNQELILVSEQKISIYQNYQLIKQKSFNEPLLMVKIDQNHKFLIILKKNLNYRLIYYSIPELNFVKQFYDNNIKSCITTIDIGWFSNKLIVCGTSDGGSIIWHIQKGNQPIKKNQVIILIFKIHNGSIQLVSINPHDNKIYYYIDR